MSFRKVFRQSILLLFFLLFLIIKGNAQRLELMGGLSGGTAGKSHYTGKRFWVPGCVVSIQYRIIHRLSIGLRTAYYYDFNERLTYDYYKTLNPIKTNYHIIPILFITQYVVLKTRFSPYVFYGLGLGYVGMDQTYALDYYSNKITTENSYKLAGASTLGLGLNYKLNDILSVYTELGALGAAKGGDLNFLTGVGVKYYPKLSNKKSN